MKIRIMGTEEECRDFVKMVRQSVPDSYIRSISNFYKNDRRKNMYSNEGRVYIDIDRPQIENTGRELPRKSRS